MPYNNLRERVQVADDECRLAFQRQILVLHVKGGVLAGVASVLLGGDWLFLGHTLGS